MFTSVLLLAASSPVIVQKNAYVLPNHSQYIKPESVTESDLKFVAITIDDTPDAVYTKQMLEILLKHGARATFFVNGGRVKAFPETAKMIAAAGHEIGNHTWSHPYLTKLSKEGIARELSTTDDIVEKVCGVKPAFFRPPYGEFNGTVNGVAASLNLIPLLWSIDTHDWSKPGVERIRKTVAGSLHNGAVILMHGTNEQSPAALELMLSDLSAKGYVTVTVSEWFQLVVGGLGIEFDTSKMAKEVLERLYDRETVEGPNGEAIEIYIPRLNSTDMKLSDLKIESSDAILSIYSNLTLVGTDEIPMGLSTRWIRPTDQIRPKSSFLEVRPDGNGFKLEYAGRMGPDYDELYFPRPKVLMTAQEDELGLLDGEAILDAFKRAGFDAFIVFGDEPRDDFEFPQWLDGIRKYYLVQDAQYPIFTVPADENLLQSYMDLLIQKRETVAVAARPFTSDAERTSFERGIGEFVRFTSLTQKYTYDPANEPRARWQLPATVDVGRFTGYNIILIMLRSRTDEVFGLKAKRDDEHFELVQFDDNGVASYGRITAGDTISIGKSPLFLAYRWGSKTNGAPEGPG